MAQEAAKQQAEYAKQQAAAATQAEKDRIAAEKLAAKERAEAERRAVKERAEAERRAAAEAREAARDPQGHRRRRRQGAALRASPGTSSAASSAPPGGSDAPERRRDERADRGHRFVRSPGPGGGGGPARARVRRGRDRPGRRHRRPRPDPQHWDGRSVEAIAALLDGCDALIHLAAIPAPGRPPARGGVHQQHPGHLRRAGGGRLGRHPARRDRVQRLGVRDGLVAAADQGPLRADRRGPPDDQLRSVRAVQGGRRAHRGGDGPAVRDVGGGAAVPLDRLARPAARGRSRPSGRSPRDWADELRSLWGYVDLRDAASACRLAIEAAADQPYGFVPLNIVAADSLVETPITDLLAEHAPEIEIRAASGRPRGRSPSTAPPR